MSEDVELAAVDASIHFVASLYDPKDKFKVTSLNRLRVRLAATRSMPIAKLPPCEDSFLQHVKRASWQTNIWTLAHQAKPDVPSPVGHGWKLQDDIVVPVFLEGPTALDKMQDFFCGCMGNAKCSTYVNCPCRRDGIGCSEVCRCEGEEQCRNPHNREDIADNAADDVELST